MDVNFILPKSPKNPAKDKPTLFAGMFLFFLAAAGLYIVSLAANGMILLFGIKKIDPWVNRLIDFLYYALFLVLPVLYYARQNPASMDGLRINPLSGKSAFLVAAAAIVGVLFVNVVTAAWMLLIESLGGHLTSSGVAVPKNTRELMTALVFSAILPALSEELLFRGAVLSGWEEKGSIKAMIITSVCFFLMHGNFEGMPAEFLTGIILAFVVISTDSLLAGVIYHTVHNAFCLILAYISSNAAGYAQTAEASSVSASFSTALDVLSLIIPAALIGSALFLLLKEIDRERLKKKRFDFGFPPAPHRPMSVSEYAVIGSGICVALMLCLTNFLEILGW